MSNVQDELQIFPLAALHYWLESSVALHWMLGGEDYKQFVPKQLRKTRERVEVIWGHVATEDNPTHRASRDKLVSKEIVRVCIKTSKWEIYFHNLLGVNWPMQTGRKAVRNG